MSPLPAPRLTRLMVPSAFLCFGQAVFMSHAEAAAAKPKADAKDSKAATAQAKTYTTRGRATGLRGGVLILKDKHGMDWEYALPPGLDAAPLVGKDVKITHTLQAQAIEVDAP